jgi:hypothetical protein
MSGRLTADIEHRLSMEHVIRLPVRHRQATRQRALLCDDG